jgi:hypothetical protein
MPCPYFEPRRALPEPTLLNARLPLIDEFDGMCRASDEPAPVPAEARLRLCNHGNVRGLCRHFPTREQRTSFRFEVLRRSAADLDLVLIEESLYAPLTWHRLTFAIEGEQFTPDPPDLCQRAQLLAFCRSYLRHYPTHPRL